MIRMNDFQGETDEVVRQEMNAVERVLKSGWFILGKEVEIFEKIWAKRCGVSYAVGVGNGMDAIEIGLRSMGIGPGDEVITTPMTAFATVLAILRAGATPVLADIDPKTVLLDTESVKRCITPRTKAVLLVHLYGRIGEMDQWITLCRDHNVILLEDCAQAHSATWKEQPAGSFGAWGAYSFYPTKNLGAIGDGGALVTNDQKLAERAKILRNYGQSERYHHPELGMNSRLDELQAAILNVRIGWLDHFTNRRKEIASFYTTGIRNPKITLLTFPKEKNGHVFHLFVVLSKERDRLSAFLKENGIETLIHYPIPVHLQVPTKGLKRDPKGLIHAENHARCCLSLPCHPQLSDEHVSFVIEALNDFR